MTNLHFIIAYERHSMNSSFREVCHICSLRYHRTYAEKSVHKSPRSLRSTGHPPTISACHSHPKITQHTPAKMQMRSKRHQSHKEARSPSYPSFSSIFILSHNLFIFSITNSTSSLNFTALSKDLVAVDYSKYHSYYQSHHTFVLL